jgi:hypothetical protein
MQEPSLKFSRISTFPRFSTAPRGVILPALTPYTGTVCSRVLDANREPPGVLP